MSTFNYVTYIRADQRQVWSALTEPEFTRQYWNGRKITSTWEPGAAVINEHDYDDGAEDMGTVLVCEPPRRLSYGTRASSVTFELTPMGEVVRLSVAHTGLGDQMWQQVTGGWQAILANLKTLLETGSPLPMPEKVLAAYR
ncbi:SRPBCC family protein [Sciscionella marina]|uniref:SRPBCC family protein n=1 Tax=Sciscionella marina TaxID=508770 RepID=UPI000369D91B|nr:SRPBCC family protein [Sciscionella marina]